MFNVGRLCIHHHADKLLAMAMAALSGEFCVTAGRVRKPAGILAELVETRECWLLAEMTIQLTCVISQLDTHAV